MRVLVVEDEDGLAAALRVGLARAGYAVDVARTVTEARDKLALSQYDLVVLDLNLPDGSASTWPRSASGQVPGPSGT